MPRGLSMLGMIGGTLICITGLGVVLDVFARGGTAQAIATVPEFIWELSLGIYPLVKGFKTSPIDEAGPPTSPCDGDRRHRAPAVAAVAGGGPARLRRVLIAP
jgi:hypothetical protein